MKDTVIRIQREPQDRKYLEIEHQTKDLYAEYKNSTVSIGDRIMATLHYDLHS